MHLRGMPQNPYQARPISVPKSLSELCRNSTKVKQFVGMQGVGAPGLQNLGMLQRQDLAAAAPVHQVLEAPELFSLIETLLEVSCNSKLIINMHSICC